MCLRMYEFLIQNLGIGSYAFYHPVWRKGRGQKLDPERNECPSRLKKWYDDQGNVRAIWRAYFKSLDEYHVVENLIKLGH